MLEITPDDVALFAFHLADDELSPPRARLPRDALEGVARDVVAQFEGDLTRHMQGESGPGSFARAFLRACLDPDGALTRTLKVSAGILAAVAINSQLLAPLRRRYDEWRRRLEDDGIDPAIAELVRSAADGLWLGNVLELGVASAAMRKRMFAKLIELTGA